MTALVEGYLSGLSSTELARRFEVGRSTVLSRLRDAGVRVRRPSEWEEKTLDLTQEQAEHLTEIVDGLMLGDGHLPRVGGLRLDQSHVRRGWVEDTQRQLKALGVSSTIDEVVRPARVRRDGRVLPPYTGCSLRTPAYVELREMRHRWYPDGLKRVPVDVRVTPTSVAAWVSGDGAATKLGGLVLYTDGFPAQDIDFLIHRLNDVFGVRARRVSKRPQIAIYRKDDVLNLRDVLLPLMSECCHYKFRHARAAQKRGVLTEEAVRDIRVRYESGIRLAVLAEEYGLSRSAINNIGLRKIYRWVQ